MEAQELAKYAPGVPYRLLAIRSLVAANRWQDASDLAACSPIYPAGNEELTRALVKAGQQAQQQNLRKCRTSV